MEKNNSIGKSTDEHVGENKCTENIMPNESAAEETVTEGQLCESENVSANMKTEGSQESADDIPEEVCTEDAENLKSESNSENAVEKKVCPKCGTEIGNGSLFCPNCGLKIDVITEPNEAIAAFNKNLENKKEKNKKLIITVISAVVAVAALLVALFFPTETRKTVRDYKSRTKAAIVTLEASESVSKETYDAIQDLYVEYTGFEEKIQRKTRMENKLYTAVAQSFDGYVKTLSASYSEDNLNELEELEDCYDTYPQEIKDQITEYDGITATVESYIRKRTQNIVSTICSYKNYDVDTMKSLFQTHKQYMTNDEIKKCVSNYRTWAAYNMASNYLKSCMKYPSTYSEVSGTAGTIHYDSDGGYYWAFETITAKAMNGFGYYNTTKYTVYISFTAPANNMSITKTITRYVFD